MGRSLEDATVEEAAEDAPLLPLFGAVLGVFTVASGILGLIVPTVTATSIPPGTAALVVVLGVVLFVGSMLRWGPKLWA